MLVGRTATSTSHRVIVQGRASLDRSSDAIIHCFLADDRERSSLADQPLTVACERGVNRLPHSTTAHGLVLVLGDVSEVGGHDE